jgi:hypothetical protein
MSNYVEVYESINIVEAYPEQNVVEVTSPGAQGPRGSVFIQGSGVPTNDVGSVGDYYVDVDDANALYGPKTDAGWPADPFGAFSTETRRSIYTQASPSSSWSITHNLGGYPSVTVVDSGKTQVIGEVTYLSETSIRVDFTQPFSGIAYLT